MSHGPQSRMRDSSVHSADARKRLLDDTKTSVPTSGPNSGSNTGCIGAAPRPVSGLVRAPPDDKAFRALSQP